MFKSNNMFNNSKYGNVLTIILIIAIIGIIGIVIFIGYNMYSKYYIETGASAAVDQFENLVSGNNTITNNNSIISADNTLISKNVIDTSNTIINDIVENPIGNTIVENPNIGGGEKNESGKTVYKGFEVVATIQIPAIKLKYPILEKVTKKSLETAVAWLYGPGLNEVGNNVIIGHNYRNGTMFSNLKNLKNGSIIYITDESGRKVKYSVYKIYRTSGDDAEYMTRDTNGKREISLSTCTDDSKARTIVLAREVE